MPLDTFLKGGLWGTSPFSDRLMIVKLAHPSNYYSGQYGRPMRECHPICLFWHEPQEPADGYESTPVFFAGEGREASTTYYGDNDGDAYQCVPLHLAPIANGWTGDIPLPRFNDGGPEFGPFSLNQQSHSAEIEGYTATIAQTMTQAQYAGCVDLAVMSMILYDWPRNPMRVGMAHADVASNRSDGIWIARKSGIPQEAVSRVLKLEKDIEDIKAGLRAFVEVTNKRNDGQDVNIWSQAVRIGALEGKK